MSRKDKQLKWLKRAAYGDNCYRYYEHNECCANYRANFVVFDFFDKFNLREAGVYRF